MSDSTFHMTKEDVRKPESKASQSNSGNVPAASDAAQAQSIVDSNTQSKADLIAERVAGPVLSNRFLPQPPLVIVLSESVWSQRPSFLRLPYLPQHASNAIPGWRMRNSPSSL